MINPLSLIIRASIRDQEALVSDPRRARWLMYRQIAAVVIFVASWAAILLLPLQLAWFGALPLAWFAGTGVISGIRQAGAYRSGWVAGRQSIIASMAESNRRGLTHEQWAMGEIERTAAVLGMDPGPALDEIRRLSGDDD